MGIDDFFQRMYGKYFDKLPNKALLLKRIAIEDENIPLTKDGLDKVQWAYLCAVPFENLDLYDYGVTLDFGINELFEKIVTQRRGGYCFELNALYMALLEELGFEVYPIGVRVLPKTEGKYIPAISHRAAIAIIDGKRYFTDVGFGLTSAPSISICIDDYSEQDILGDIFTVEDRPFNNKVIIRHTEDGPLEFFMFVPDPFNILDFIPYNTTIQAEVFWRAKRMINLRMPNGSISIDGDIFRRNIGGERTEVPLSSPDDVATVLKKEYGMILPDIRLCANAINTEIVM